MMRLAIPLIVFLAIGALLLAGLTSGRDPSLVPSPLIDKPAPTFALPALRNPDRTLRSTDLAGSPYLLNVWGSWCPSCRLEHPIVEAIAQDGKVPVYGLNWKDARPDALRWLQRFGDPYVASFHDEDGRVGIDFGVYAAPETFLVDGQGVIRYKYIGPMTFDIYREEILPRLARLGAGT